MKISQSCEQRKKKYTIQKIVIGGSAKQWRDKTQQQMFGVEKIPRAKTLVRLLAKRITIYHGLEKMRWAGPGFQIIEAGFAQLSLCWFAAINIYTSLFINIPPFLTFFQKYPQFKIKPSGSEFTLERRNHIHIELKLKRSPLFFEDYNFFYTKNLG